MLQSPEVIRVPWHSSHHICNITILQVVQLLSIPMRRRPRVSASQYYCFQDAYWNSPLNISSISVLPSQWPIWWFALCNECAALSRIPGHEKWWIYDVSVSFNSTSIAWWMKREKKSLQRTGIWSLWKRHRFRYSIALRLPPTRRIWSMYYGSSKLYRADPSWHTCLRETRVRITGILRGALLPVGGIRSRMVHTQLQYPAFSTDWSGYRKTISSLIFLAMNRHRRLILRMVADGDERR